jgi:hypothetical protein
VALAAVLCASGASSGANLLELSRGVHPDFELLVIYCDTLPQFRLFYDRVAGELRLETDESGLGERFLRSVARFPPGTTVSRLEADRETGELFIGLQGLTFIRQYLVNGPPALLIDVSRAQRSPDLMPFELGRNDYLLRGGIEERKGRLDIAAQYLDRAQEIGPYDAVLDHRAGIIQHRLGRYDLALETFGRTAQSPDLAADARARRAMIYLLRGDTAASGSEWTGYFHPAAEARGDSALTAEAPAGEKSTPEKTGKRRPGEFIKAETGVNMLVGWGLLLVGVAALMGLLLGSNRPGPLRMGWQMAAGDYADDGEPPGYPAKGRGFSRGAASDREDDSTEYRRPRPDRPTVSRRMQAAVRPSAAAADDAGLMLDADRLAGGRHIPRDQILRRSQMGVDELQIARELGMGQDEVSMVINLARLAKKRQN